MRGNVFINYRRDDSAGWTGRLYDRLTQSLPERRVFIDVDDIPPGADFVRLLDQHVSRCDVVLVIIGPGWLDARDEAGARRIDDASDFVRIEIASALRRETVHVIPVLVGGARMPSAAELPDELQALVHRNAVELSAGRFHRDADRLIAAVQRALPWPVRLRRALGVTVTVSAIAATGAALYAAILTGAVSGAFGLERHIRPAAREWATFTYVDKTNPAALTDFVARHGGTHEAEQATRWLRYVSARAWSRVQDSAEPNALADFIQTFPASREAKLAEQRVVELRGASGAPGREPRSALTRFRDCAEPRCPELIVIPPGKFTMGSPEIERTMPQDEHEAPRHPIAIPRAFAVGRFEVTVGQFRAFVEATGHAMGDECIGVMNPADASKVWEGIPGRSYDDPGFAQSDTHPVVCVSWLDALAYLEWLSAVTGFEYRLPTEAEWEYAARAGSATSYAFGDDESLLCQYGNGADRSLGTTWNINPWCTDGTRLGTAPAGTYLPNAFGLRDVHGNVHEWVADCYHPGYEEMPPSTRETGAAWTEPGCAARVIRGGCWAYPPTQLRSARREMWEPRNRSYCVGFRVARSLER